MGKLVEERYSGRSGRIGESPFERVQWNALEYDNTADIYIDVASAAPSTMNDLRLRAISVEPHTDVENCWIATADYGPVKSLVIQETGTVAYRFNFQMQSMHIYRSLATIDAVAAPGETLPDFGRLINVVFDGTNNRPEGLQLNAPSENFSLDFAAPNLTVTPAYQLTVESIQGCVNNATFKGRPAGSLLFVRCNGGFRTDEDWSISFGFAYSPNQTSIEVNEDITIAAKDGHDLLWTYNDSKNEGGLIVQKPHAAYVERVYPRADFSLLGLGV